MSSAPAIPPRPQHRGVVWLVAGALFMELLDATVITTALPQMAQTFHVRAVDLSTGMSAYMLALAVFIPLSGWIADRFGPRQVFASALLIFTAASLLCSLSTSLWEFTAARVLQGMGGALMVPVGQVLVLRSTTKDRLVNAIAMLTWPALTAPVLGPPLGGFITTHWGWHWIFLLNIPLGLFGFLLTLRLVSGQAGQRRPFDTPGFLLSGVGCSALMLACDLSSHSPFKAVQVGLFGIIGVTAMILAVRHLRRAPHPLVDLAALAIPTFSVAMWSGSLFRIALSSAPFLLPLMFQLVFDLPATTSGLLLLALFAGNICMKPGTSWVMRRWGFRRVLAGNGLLVALGFLASASLSPATPRAAIVAVLFVCGMCRSMQFTCINSLSFGDVPAERMNGASTLSSIYAQMSSGLGVAIAALALQIGALMHGSAGATPTLTDFRLAFVMMALVSLLALAGSLRLPANAGAQVSGHAGRR